MAESGGVRMTAIKIGERYRFVSPGRYANQVVEVVERGIGFHWSIVTPDGTRYAANSAELLPLETVTPSFSNGDVVKLTSPDGKNLIQGPVFEDIWMGTISERVNIRLRLDVDWSLEVVERAPKPLPTEPGLYVMKGTSGNPDPIILCFSDDYWGFTHRGDRFEGEAESIARSWMRGSGLRRLIEEPTS